MLSWGMGPVSIHRVVVRLIDPHRRNQGRGIQMVREAGIPVARGILQDEAAQDVAAYHLQEATEHAEGEL